MDFRGSQNPCETVNRSWADMRTDPGAKKQELRFITSRQAAATDVMTGLDSYQPLKSKEMHISNLVGYANFNKVSFTLECSSI